MFRIRMITLLAASLIFCTIGTGDVLKKSDLHGDPDAMPDERSLKQTVSIGPDTKFDASIEETSKGNGVLEFANLSLHVIDEHDDGAVYEEGMAHVEFADVDGAGWKDLIVTGIVDYTDRETRGVVRREPFTFIFKYDPKMKLFHEAYRFASFDLKNGLKGTW